MPSSQPPLPNFLIIGAARCATRWLRFNLNQHPDVFMPPVPARLLRARRPSVRGSALRRRPPPASARGCRWYRLQFTAVEDQPCGGRGLAGLPGPDQPPRQRGRAHRRDAPGCQARRAGAPAGRPDVLGARPGGADGPAAGGHRPGRAGPAPDAPEVETLDLDRRRPVRHRPAPLRQAVRRPPAGAAHEDIRSSIPARCYDAVLRPHRGRAGLPTRRAGPGAVRRPAHGLAATAGRRPATPPLSVASGPTWRSWRSCWTGTCRTGIPGRRRSAPPLLPHERLELAHRVGVGLALGVSLGVATGRSCTGGSAGPRPARRPGAAGWRPPPTTGHGTGSERSGWRIPADHQERRAVAALSTSTPGPSRRPSSSSVAGSSRPEQLLEHGHQQPGPHRAPDDALDHPDGVVRRRDQNRAAVGRPRAARPASPRPDRLGGGRWPARRPRWVPGAGGRRRPRPPGTGTGSEPQGMADPARPRRRGDRCGPRAPRPGGPRSQPASSSASTRRRGPSSCSSAATSRSAPTRRRRAPSTSQVARSGSTTRDGVPASGPAASAPASPTASLARRGAMADGPDRARAPRPAGRSADADHRVGQRQARAAACACPRPPRTGRRWRPPARPPAAPRPGPPARRPRLGRRRRAAAPERGTSSAEAHQPSRGPLDQEHPPSPTDQQVPGRRPGPTRRPARAGRSSRRPRRRDGGPIAGQQVQRRSLGQRGRPPRRSPGEGSGRPLTGRRRPPTTTNGGAGRALQHLHRCAPRARTANVVVVDRAGLAQQPFQGGRQQAGADPPAHAAVDQERCRRRGAGPGSWAWPGRRGPTPPTTGRRDRVGHPRQRPPAASGRRPHRRAALVGSWSGSGPRSTSAGPRPRRPPAGPAAAR